MSGDGKEGGWMRPLTFMETYLEEQHRQGALLSAYTITLNAKSVLDENVFRKALTHLFRKVPTLSLCVRVKEDKPWYHHMDREEIDFQVLDEDIKKVQMKLKSYQYDTFNGPLWSSRLVSISPKEHCQLPEIGKKFPHQYYLLFGFHHMITDGTSNAIILEAFTNIINDVVGGIKVNDDEKIGNHVSDDRTMKIILETAKEILTKPKQVEDIRKLILAPTEECLFLKAFPPPICKEENPKTYNIDHSFTSEQTCKFISRCKKENISVHSGFYSVVNAALVHMISQAGLKQSLYEIDHYHIINIRQYWEEKLNDLGPHIGKVTMITLLYDKIDDFWKHAREYHDSFVQNMNNKTCLKESAVLMNMMMNNKLTYEALKMRPKLNYGTTNMGNLSSVFRGEGSFVQVTDVRRTTSTENNLCSHVLHTFRGRMVYGLDYQSDSMTSEMAHKYLNTVVEFFHKVTNLK